MPPPEPGPGSALRPLLLATLVYAALAVLFTWPMVTQLDTHIIGGPRDGPMFVWNQWWGGHALFELGQNPLRTEHLFYPHGTSLVINTHAVGSSILSWPLQKAFGVLVGFNLWLILSIVLSGVGAWLLAYEILKDRRAAFIAGLAFAFCHYRSSFLLFYNLAQSQFLVLYCWALWATIARSSWRHAAATGLFATILALCSYNLAVLAGLVSVPLVACGLVLRLRASGRRGLGGLALRGLLLVGVAAVTAAPLALELRDEIDRHGNYASMRKEARDDDRELQRTVSEEETKPLRRYGLRGPMEGELGGVEVEFRRASYLGWSVLLLALLGVARFGRRPAVLLWLLIALAFFACSLGPELDLGPIRAAGVEPDESVDRMALPYAWLRDQPVLDQLRVPHRYGVVGCLALAMLAGLGWHWIGRRLAANGRERRADFLTLGAGLLIFLDFLQYPFPMTTRMPTPPPPLAAAYEAIREDPRECCVMDFPAGRKGYKAFSWYDTFHQKPIYLDGQVARRLRHLEPYRKDSELRNALVDAFGGKQFDKAELNRLKYKLRQEIEENRIGWIVIAWSGEARFSKSALAGEPPPLLQRCRALTRLVRGALPLDPGFATLVEQRGDSWTPEEGDLLRCPNRDVNDWEELRPTEQFAAPTILLVAKLDFERE